MCFVYFNEKSVFYMRYKFDFNYYLDENLRVRRVKMSATTLFNPVFLFPMSYNKLAQVAAI